MHLGLKSTKLSVNVELYQSICNLPLEENANRCGLLMSKVSYPIFVHLFLYLFFFLFTLMFLLLQFVFFFLHFNYIAIYNKGERRKVEEARALLATAEAKVTALEMESNTHQLVSQTLERIRDELTSKVSTLKAYLVEEEKVKETSIKAT